MSLMTAQYPGADQPRDRLGQFASVAKMGPEVAIRELSDEEYNADGSYAFPPDPRSAAQHIAFWTSVPLPDEKLAVLLARYPEIRQQTGIDAGNAAAEAYKRDHDDPTRFSDSKKAKAEGEKWKAEVGRVWQAAHDKAVAPMPERIYRTTVRPLLRAHQMNAYKSPLPADDQYAVLAHEMVVDGQTMTVEQIVNAYRLDLLTNELI